MEWASNSKGLYTYKEHLIGLVPAPIGCFFYNLKYINMIRDTRQTPFAWQEKKILRHIQNNYKNIKESLAVYLVITQLSSDNNNTSQIEDFWIKIMEMSWVWRDSLRNILNKFHEDWIILLEKWKLSNTRDNVYSKMKIELLTIKAQSQANCQAKKPAKKSLPIEESIEENIEENNTSAENFEFQSKREIKEFITEMYNKDNSLFDVAHLRYIWPWIEKLRERGYKVKKMEWDIIGWYKYFKETTTKHCWITNTWPAYWEMELVLERMFNWLDEKEKKSWNIKNTILTFLTKSKWK